MNNSLAVVGSPFSFADMERLAESIAKSRLFGIQTPDQALTLMAISQAEGRHPALAASEYGTSSNSSRPSTICALNQVG